MADWGAGEEKSFQMAISALYATAYQWAIGGEAKYSQFTSAPGAVVVRRPQIGGKSEVFRG